MVINKKKIRVREENNANVFLSRVTKRCMTALVLETGIFLLRR